MPYIVGLLIILALIFSGWNGIGLTGNFLNQMKDKVSSTIFPKTEGEILIENLNSNYQVLDKFFGESANSLLNSKNISEDDKKSIKKAIESFTGSKNLLSKIEKLEKEDKGLFKAIVEKVLNLNEPLSPDPTSIPPQCRLECPSN